MADLIRIEELNEQLQLKPSFKVEVADLHNLEKKLVYKKVDCFLAAEIKRLDDHIWLSIPKADRTYYSPRLHIEIEQKEEKYVLHGTFGPDPGLWTMFMFVHFFLGLSFIGLLVWLYTNMTLGHSSTLVYILMSIIAISWIALYMFARRNRHKATPQSKQLLKALSKLIG
ncbi:hypothetical protein [Psychroflexus sediminis]|uniref:GTP-binding protein n=1 Tax=Psychroflexus sediminis TaxID=470826 RepID=A0A1G7VV77_9FLAO|nr:hypothetical protein [Psychroflexus sediminis]SDG63745.1 hypothetical protein SAMN04488027_104192 [Psychroflexus sediminis]